jgi:hypothetical protein
MYYVIHVDHHGGYQGIMSKFKTLREAKAEIEHSEVCGEKVTRIGRIGYWHPSDSKGEYSFCRVIVEVDLNLRKATGKSRFYEPFVLPDDYKEPEKYEKFFGEIDRVLDILTDHVSLISDWGDDED